MTVPMRCCLFPSFIARRSFLSRNAEHVESVISPRRVSRAYRPGRRALSWRRFVRSAVCPPWLTCRCPARKRSAPASAAAPSPCLPDNEMLVWKSLGQIDGDESPPLDRRAGHSAKARHAESICSRVRRPRPPGSARGRVEPRRQLSPGSTCDGSRSTAIWRRYSPNGSRSPRCDLYRARRGPRYDNHRETAGVEECASVGELPS